jgi:hypothetical protein
MALPRSTETVRWKTLAADLTDGEIAHVFGVTRQAVSKTRSAAGVAPKRTRMVTVDYYVAGYIPWRPIAQAHYAHPLYRRLRLWARHESGAPMSDKEFRMLELFLGEMANTDYPPPHRGCGPVVIVYDYDDPEGFWLEPARPGEFLVRRPVTYVA